MKSKTAVLKDSSRRDRTSVPEKITYGLGGVGYQMTLALVNAFLTLYYTDSVLISASFVGTMMLAARVMDGVSDIIMGFVIEKTKTRFGKARPWVILGAIPLALSIVLLFNVPASFSPISKNVYVFLTYVFMSVICYTIVALAHTAMLPRISLRSSDRNIVLVVIALMQGIMTAAMVGVFAPLLQALGGERSQHAWTVISALVAVTSLLLLALCFFVTREKISALEQTPEEKNGTAADPKEKGNIKKALMFLLKGRYFYIILILSFTGAITNGTAGIGIYYMRDVLGDANLMGIFSIVSVVPMIIMMPLVPKLFAKFGKKKTVSMSLGAVILVRIVMYLFPTNLPLQLVCAFLGILIVVPLWLGIPAMVCDLVDYSDYRCGIRTEGLTTSVSSFGTKLGSGLGAVILGSALAIGGYDPLASAQSASALSAIIFVMFGVPLIMFVICFVLVRLWDLEKYEAAVTQYMEGQRSEGMDA